jgi:NDP-sugar pyrophosphorylase family protein
MVDPSARIEGGSLISADVVIEAGVLVQGSIIFERAQIGAEASLVDTFVAANTEIPAAFIAEGQFFGFFQ